MLPTYFRGHKTHFPGPFEQCSRENAMNRFYAVLFVYSKNQHNVYEKCGLIYIDNVIVCDNIDPRQGIQ
jgi:hypothetical protein